MWTDRQTDRHTDMTKLTVAFHNFAKATKRTTNIRYVWRVEKKQISVTFGRMWGWGGVGWGFEGEIGKYIIAKKISLLLHSS